jgi:ribosome-associated protein
MTREDAATPDSNQVAAVALAAVDELKGADVCCLDVSDQTAVTDTLVIVSGTSARHVQSLSHRVVERAREAGIKPLGVEGERGADWLLVDLGDVVVHIMSREQRDFYKLEKLWSMGESDSATG